MKKLLIITLLGLMCANLCAQGYEISFVGSGESTTVDSVEVENINTGEVLAFPGKQVLLLVGDGVGVNDLIKNNNGDLKIFPNPITESSTIEFILPNSGKTNVEIFDILGNKVVSTTNILYAGRHSFIISGLIGGIYAIKVYSNEFSYTGKFLSNNQSGSNPAIIYNLYRNLSSTLANLKSAQTDVVMQYHVGDRLKITGTSGVYRTTITEIPDQSKVIKIPFIKCSDADGNNYSVVKIGTQYWTVENLKTTKYKDSTEILNVVSDIHWANLTTGAYCNFDHIESNADTYGRLYNWHAVNTGKLAIVGWHVPTDVDWTILENYLIAKGYNYDGTKDENKIAKSISAKTNWLQFGSPGAPGSLPESNNSTGFSALPSGCRYAKDMYFSGIGAWCIWWGSTEISESSSYGWDLNFYIGRNHMLGKNSYDKEDGFSVRLVKD